jgi:DNA-binding transcriptional LysR family regulator
MNTNLLHLRYFYTVAKEGSFTRAAEKLRIAQPALSRMIKELEESFEKELLIRSKKQITLTEHGRVAFKNAQSIFDQFMVREKFFSKEYISNLSPLRIGTSDVLASHIFPETITQFAKDESVYPLVQIGASSELCDLVEKRSLDFALLFHTPEPKAALVHKAFCEMHFYLVISKKFMKNHETRTSFIGSREVDEVTNKKFPTLAKWKEVEPRSKIKISTNSIQAHLAMVKEGLGIAVLPAFLVQKEIAQGVLIDLLPKENLEFKLNLITHRDYPLNLRDQKFLRTFQSCLGN